MKNVYFFLVVIISFFNCVQTQKITTPKNASIIRAEVNTLLNNWHKAASDADYKAYFKAMDSVAVFIGTDATENWNKTQFANFSKPFFNKGKAWSFKPLERNVYVSAQQNFVWFDELLDTWMGTCRGSGVLEKKNNTWLIKHYVLSVEIPNNDVQAVIKAKKKSDSIFLTRFNN